jgi:predicted DNA-binding transcriptional regulator AlpA
VTAPGPEARRLQISEVEAWAGAERTTIGRWVRAGTFPAPERFGQRRVWLLADLERWREQRQAVKP